jgi:hypothetical protein
MVFKKHIKDIVQQDIVLGEPADFAVICVPPSTNFFARMLDGYNEALKNVDIAK